MNATNNFTTTRPDHFRNKSIVVVLGMHRSGTSLLTNLLTSLGVDVGQNLIGADANNQSGYWEQRAINDAQDRLLAQLRTRWQGPAWMNPFPLGWRQLNDETRQHFKSELTSIIGSELGKAKSLWGFKDPRTSRLLPLWKEIFSELGIKPRYVLAIRHPGAVAASLTKRDRLAASHAELLWLIHNLEAVREASDDLRWVVDYDRWFTHPKAQATELARALDLPLSDESERHLSNVELRIRSDLRHWKTERPFVIPYVEPVFNLLTTAAFSGEISPEIHRIYDEVSQAFEQREPWTVVNYPDKSWLSSKEIVTQKTVPEFLEQSGDIEITEKTSDNFDRHAARLVAFYLPQFHPIPENDEWWGRGFTEWNNVVKATPRFAEHHQPHLPGDLGFYDLRLPEARAAQANIARAHGIEAFCYWHYWFNGRQVLERPFNEVLASGQPDFGFCLAWANENWTRRWDGQEREILLKQTYGGPEDDRKHFNYLLPAFRDPRAFRIAGKPVFLIYRPAKIPNLKSTLDLWRQLAAEAGLSGLHLIAMKTCFEGQDRDWTQAGFDAELYFQPDFSSTWLQASKLLPETGDRVVRYAEAWPLMSRAAANHPAGVNRFTCVVPAWDNSARRKREAVILHDSSPAEYGHWLRAEISRVQDRPEQHRVVFINAWNEWAEGNHLEPDQKWGRAYLEETQRANRRQISMAEIDQILRHAETLIGQDKFTQAVEWLRCQIQTSPDCTALRLGLGMALLQVDDRLGALAELSEVCRSEPANIDAAKLMASVLIDLDRITEAATALRHASRLAPADVTVQNALGNCLAHLGDPESAILAYQRVLELEPGNESANQMLRELGASKKTSSKANNILAAETCEPTFIIPTELRQPPKVSIIIPVLNKAAFTRQCLTALQQNTTTGSYEVIIWDNGSTDETPEFLTQLSTTNQALRYFRNDENLGFVGGNNAAVQHARGEFLVFLNNDTEPQPGWLDALLHTAESEPGAGAVGAKLIYPNGTLQEAGGIVFRDASGWNYGRTQDPHDSRFNFLREVDYCSAACLLVRTELFRQLGGFDRRYAPAYYEDTDLCFAIRQLGYRVLYQPDCEVIHHEGATAGQDVTRGFKQYQVLNQQKFFQKWKHILPQQSAPDAALVRRASNRANGQRILVVDPFLPMYDRASGSKRLFEMLKLLVAGGHAVSFIARVGQDGERYVAELRRLGIEVYAGDAERMRERGFNFLCRNFDLKKLLQESHYDTVILSFWELAEQYLPRIREWSPRSRVVIDTVDVHFLRERRQAELLQDRALLEQAEKTHQRELATYKAADALITVTEDDRQVLLQEIPHSQIFLVANIHDVAEEIPAVDSRSGCLFIGNFNHLPNVDAVLHFHREIWPHILQQLPDARWTIVGNNPPPPIRALEGPGIEVTGYVPSLEPYLRSHLVSVAPLRYGAGMKGKIGESLANGLPVVTSQIGAEGMDLQNGDRGALVSDDPVKFARHVVQLHENQDLWHQLSSQGRRHIESCFTPARIACQLEKVLTWSRSFSSIILLAHNELEHTRACLENIAECTHLPHEVIVVDNGSTDDTPKFLRQWQATHPNCIVIRNETNRGFAAGNNQGLAIARGESVILLNNDTIVTAGWLEGLNDVLKQHPRTGIIGPMSNYVSGPQLVREANYRNFSELPAFAAQWRLKHEGQSFQVGRAVGFCLFATRQVIETIGGLDEQFGSGNFEDDDFCIRAGLAGFEIRIAESVFIHHTGNQTFKGAKINYSDAMLRNWGLFKTKWQLPAEQRIEQGYQIPMVAPSPAVMKFALADLNSTHRPDATRQHWAGFEPASQGTMPSARKASVTLPACALVGQLTKIRDLFQQNDYRAAWEATLAAIARRPFHPEAWLLLAEIAQSVGDGHSAKICARRSRRTAPSWKPAKQFINQQFSNGTRPDWLKLPEEIVNASAKPQKLSVCLITKNEEAFLDKCLQSVRAIASQIVVVDTGSTDRTREIAKEYGAEIHSFTWCDDFSAARNAALEHATGDWILVLDADEELPSDQIPKLRDDMKQSGVIALRLPLVNSGQEAEGNHFVPRLFRNIPGVFYHGRIHEQVFPSLLPPAKAWGLKPGFGSARIIHHGYTKELTRDRNKVERNLQLLKMAVAENPDDSHLHMSYGFELSRSGDLSSGIVQYRLAFDRMSSQAPESVPPELREVLLTQFASQLYKLRLHQEIVQVLNSPLARRQNGLTASLHFALGLAHFELKQFREAADHMRQCMARRKQPVLSPINTDIHTAAPEHCLALSLAKLGDTKAAEAAFQVALAARHLDKVPLDYAKFLVEQGRAVDGLKSLHEMISQSPENVAAWQLGGEIALGDAEFLEFAQDWTGEALKHHPADGILLMHRAEALMNSLNLAAAAQLWLQLWEQERNPKALAALILCELAEGVALTHAPETGSEETACSREFIAWYQKLIAVKANALILRLNEQTDALSRTLPKAAAILKAALGEAALAA